MLSQQISRKTKGEDMPEWLTPREASLYSGLSLWAIYQNVHRGHIPHRRIGPKMILIPKSYFDVGQAMAQVTP